MVFDECRREDDWKDAKKAKTRWNLLEYYHPSDKGLPEASAPEADTEATEAMKRKAYFNKYLEKSGAGAKVD